MSDPAELDLSTLSSIPDPLAARAAQPGEPPAPPPPVEIGPTRTALRRRRILAVALGIAWLLAVQVVIGIRNDVAPHIMALHVGVPTALGAVALWLALRPGRIGLGSDIRVVVGFGIVAPIAFGIAALSAPCLENAETVAGGAFFCGDFIMAVAVLPLLGLVWAMRRTFAAGAGFRAGLVGAAVGFTAAGIQALHCAHSDGLHVLFGHSWPVLMMAGLTWLLLRRSLAVG